METDYLQSSNDSINDVDILQKSYLPNEKNEIFLLVDKGFDESLEKLVILISSLSLILPAQFTKKQNGVKKFNTMVDRSNLRDSMQKEINSKNVEEVNFRAVDHNFITANSTKKKKNF